MYYSIRCNFFYNHFTGLNTAKVGPFARGLRLTSTARTGAAFTSTALCFPGERRLGSSEPTVRLLSPRPSPLGESERNLQQSSQLGSLRARERKKERRAEASVSIPPSGVSPFLGKNETSRPPRPRTQNTQPTCNKKQLGGACLGANNMAPSTSQLALFHPITIWLVHGIGRDPGFALTWPFLLQLWPTSQLPTNT